MMLRTIVASVLALAALVEFTYSANLTEAAMEKSASPEIRWAVFAAAFWVTLIYGVWWLW